MIIVGTNTFLQMAKQLKDEGTITLEQYAGVLRRSKNIPQHLRGDTIVKCQK